MYTAIWWVTFWMLGFLPISQIYYGDYDPCEQAPWYVTSCQSVYLANCYVNPVTNETTNCN